VVDSQEEELLSKARLNRSLKISLATSVVAILSSTISVITSINSEIKAFSASTLTLFASQKHINILKGSLKAGKLKQTISVITQ
jgi:hypothetical protein